MNATRVRVIPAADTVALLDRNLAADFGDGWSPVLAALNLGGLVRFRTGDGEVMILPVDAPVKVRVDVTAEEIDERTT